MTRLVEGCGLEVKDWEPLWEKLSRDSQEGTRLARTELRVGRRELSDSQLDEARRLLATRGLLDELG